MKKIKTDFSINGYTCLIKKYINCKDKISLDHPNELGASVATCNVPISISIFKVIL